ncbi:MAG: VTT domain-containing protein [Planctomycetota bacterium]
MSTKQTIRELGRPAVIMFMAAAMAGLGGAVALAVLIGWSDELRDGGLQIALFLFVLGTFGCGLWLMPTHVLSLVCGWSLGFPLGAVVALSAATLASPLGYVVGGKLAGPGAMAWAERYPKGAAVCEAITRASAWRAGWLVGLLRLSPVVPYGATNVLAAAFTVRMGAFIWGTALGLAPRVIAVAGLGAGLEQLELTRPSGVGWLVVGVAATVLVLTSMGWMAWSTLRRLTPAETPRPNPPQTAVDAVQ